MFSYLYSYYVTGLTKLAPIDEYFTVYYRLSLWSSILFMLLCNYTTIRIAYITAQVIYFHFQYISYYNSHSD